MCALGQGPGLQVGSPPLGQGLGPRLRSALGLGPSLGPPPGSGLALQVGPRRLWPPLGQGPLSYDGVQ